MPVTYEIDADRSLIRTRCVGALAVVAPRDVLFGMSRMLEMLAEPHFTSTRVFRDRAPAEAWLASRGRAS